jgi:selenoprotein W-related protein
MTTSLQGVGSLQDSGARHRAAEREARRQPIQRIRLTIEYCEVGNYSKIARRLATQLLEEFRGWAIELELRPSNGGVFEVSVDGRPVFSKKATSRIPEADEISYHIAAARGAALKSPIAAGGADA